MIKVFAFPPVAVVGTEWTEESPVQISRSMITGADYTSTIRRKRRLATVVVSALAGEGQMGAGYVEMLKRHLEGVHAVRLTSQPINWFLDAAREAETRQTTRLLWQSGGEGLDWSAGSQPLAWFTGTLLTGTVGTADGWQTITISGLPPRRLVARPGEFVTAFYGPNDFTGVTAQITAPAFSGPNGGAVVRLFDNLPAGADLRVNLGTAQSAAFKPVSYPRAVQPLSGDWSYTWEFREVFADEVGGFEEVNPWR